MKTAAGGNTFVEIREAAIHRCRKMDIYIYIYIFISSGHGERQAAHTGCGNKEVMDNVDIQGIEECKH